jgi:methionyl-tRNA formyltransferase
VEPGYDLVRRRVASRCVDHRMRIVLLTNGATHGLRILEELRRSRIALAAVILEKAAPPGRPRLSECIRELGYRTTASVLRRELTEAWLPSLPTLRYRRFASNARRVTDLNSSQCKAMLEALRPDLILLGGARILKPPILECARLAVLNAHPGLLPTYRGNDVIAWALHNGDQVGVSVHVVDSGIDTGAVIMTRELPVARGESIPVLTDKAEALAGVMMSQAVLQILATGRIEPIAVTGPRGPLYGQMPKDVRAALDQKRGVE